ncbi:unnamed protein product [Polarella glacialis]|uniref:Uncharacterized protein n=3 Tax=Polarella glacialis TaxID=89957 RepID=A0A813IAM1_POLGL|nr:unnamed protein product [Polarella glacialis]
MHARRWQGPAPGVTRKRTAEAAAPEEEPKHLVGRGWRLGARYILVAAGSLSLISFAWGSSFQTEDLPVAAGGAVAQGRLIKIIHQQYRTSDQSTFPFLLWVSFQERWKQLHPGWKHFMWTDKTEEELIETELPEILPMYKGIDKKCSRLYYIMKADIASHAVLYVHGGMYADMDSIPIIPLDDSILDEPPRSASFWRFRRKRPPPATIVYPSQPNPRNVDNDLMLSTQVKHPFIYGCLMSIKGFWERHRNFICSFAPPPEGANSEPFDAYFPLLWFAASRRLLMCAAAWQGPEKGMDLKQIAAWEDSLAEASRLLPRSKENSRRIFEEVYREIYLRGKEHPPEDIRVDKTVGRGRFSKSTMESHCAGPCAHVLDGRKEEVVSCMAEEAADQGKESGFKPAFFIFKADDSFKPRFVLFNLEDSSWEGSAAEKARQRLRQRHRCAELEGFFATDGDCTQDGFNVATRPDIHSPEGCQAECVASSSCTSFDLPIVQDEEGPSCRLSMSGRHYGNRRGDNVCFVKTTANLEEFGGQPFQLEPEPATAEAVDVMAEVPPSICMAHYHKTGSDLAEGLAADLGLVMDRKFVNLNEKYNAWSTRFHPEQPAVGNPERWHGWSKHSAMDLHELLAFAEESPGLYTASEALPSKLRNTAVVHFVRHPLSQIVSAYRYHCEEREYWVKQKGKCNFCAESDWQANFALCGFGCTYGELLHGVNETLGVQLEFRNQRLTLQTMLANMQNWRDDPKVLSLSLGQFESDYKKTIRCIGEFLRLSEAQASSFLASAQRHDLGGRKNARQRGHSTRTRYRKEANLALQKVLIDSGAFGNQLEAITSLYHDSLDRGTQLYGCPIEVERAAP